MRGNKKQICVILLEMAVLCLLSACARNESGIGMGSQEINDSVTQELSSEDSSSKKDSTQLQTTGNASSEQIDSTESKQDANVSSEIKESYEAVLLGNRDFVSTDLHNKELSLKNIGEAVTDDDSVKVKATQFTIVDLEGNGENEIVLWIQINEVSDYGFEILYYQDKKVYGFTLTYREFMELKTDGTFLFSGGAADTGIGRLQMSENGYIIDKLYYSESQYDSNNELKIQYFANGEPCSEEEFNNAMNQQEEKPNVKWYDLTTESIEVALENRF